MSEQHDSDGSGCLLLLGIAGLIVILYIVGIEVTKRDSWIRDLQRRVAELEQRR